MRSLHGAPRGDILDIGSISFATGMGLLLAIFLCYIAYEQIKENGLKALLYVFYPRGILFVAFCILDFYLVFL